MQFFQETTSWADTTPNHVYLLNDSKDKMFAYVPDGSNKVVQFKSPIVIKSKGRTFRPVDNKWKFNIEEPQQENPRWEVAGSNGAKYIVELIEGSYTCTCPGYKYRGECKHIKEKQQ